MVPLWVFLVTKRLAQALTNPRCADCNQGKGCPAAYLSVGYVMAGAPATTLPPFTVTHITKPPAGRRAAAELAIGFPRLQHWV
jgi:hypothetical protein